MSNNNIGPILHRLAAIHPWRTNDNDAKNAVGLQHSGSASKTQQMEVDGSRWSLGLSAASGDLYRCNVSVASTVMVVRCHCCTRHRTDPIVD